MKRNTKIVAGGVALVLVAGSLAFAGQGYREHREMRRLISPEALMERADANDDLALSVEEVLTAVKLKFDQADQDSNGEASKAEIVGMIEAVDGMPKLKRHSGKIADRIFKQLDINEDGKLANHEVENRLRKFYALADWNDDGAVELAEIQRSAKHRGAKRWKHWQDHDENSGNSAE